MKKIIYKLINELTKGSNIYTYNGSTWLIFEDTKQWVIELTEDKVLWYNYTLFKNIFVYASMDVVENQHYITKWVEDNIINGVKKTGHWGNRLEREIEEPIQNGVKKTFNTSKNLFWQIGTTIQYGVKETQRLGSLEVTEKEINNTIQNGVKIKPALESNEGFKQGTPYVEKFFSKEDVDNTIQNGVKETLHDSYHHNGRIDGVINNGIKKTKEMDEWVNSPRIVENVIQNGIKEVKSDSSQNPMGQVDDVIENGVKETRLELNITEGEIEEIIENGIKEIQPLPSQKGNRDWGIYYQRKGNRTKPHTEYVDDVIKEGIKNK